MLNQPGFFDHENIYCCPVGRTSKCFPRCTSGPVAFLLPVTSSVLLSTMTLLLHAKGAACRYGCHVHNKQSTPYNCFIRTRGHAAGTELFQCMGTNVWVP